jgi:hypothetical protein
MRHAREAIIANRYLEWKKEFLERYFSGNSETKLDTNKINNKN